MATGTFSQIYIQIVFAVKGRRSLIHPSWENDLYKYITGIIKNKGQKLMIINGVEDHVHILIGMKPNCCLSDLVREIKKSSNIYINQNKFVRGKFEWQNGYGAFSYNQSIVKNVIRYIENQKIHHQKKSFQSEYKEFLDKYEIDYKEEYLFDWVK